jgi:hypothetical protein
VAILSQTGDAAGRALAALAALGRTAQVLDARRVRAGRIEFGLTLIEVKSGGED